MTVCTYAGDSRARAGSPGRGRERVRDVTDFSRAGRASLDPYPRPGANIADSATYIRRPQRPSATYSRRSRSERRDSRQVAGIHGEQDADSDIYDEYDNISEESDTVALLNVYVSDVRLQGGSVKRSPQIEIKTLCRDGRTVTSAWTPDTGAEISAISHGHAEQMGVEPHNLTQGLV